MADLTHTSAPWRVTGRAGYTGHGVSAGGKRICSINSNSPLLPAERDANAKLIAAAPELLAELEKLAIALNALSARNDTPPHLMKPLMEYSETARSIISKATQS